MKIFGPTRTEGSGVADVAIDTKYAVTATLSRASRVVKLSAYLDGLGAGSGNQVARAFVYDSGGTALLAVSEEVTITDGQPAGWVDFPLTEAVELVPASYRIGLHFGPNTTVARQYRSPVRWTGTAHGSTSVNDATGKTNVVKNPSFETNLTNTRNFSGLYGNAETITRESPGQVGDYAAKVLVTALGTGVGDLAEYSIGFKDDGLGYVVLANSGPVTGKVWVKAPAGKSVYARLVRTKADGTGAYGLADNDVTTTATATGNWQQLTVAMGTYLPGGALGFEFRVGLRYAGTVIGDWILIDGAIGQAGTTDVIYFDGSGFVDAAGRWVLAAQGVSATDTYSDGTAATFGTTTAVGAPAVFATYTNAWELPIEEDAHYARYGFSSAQRKLGEFGPLRQFPPQVATCGWHGTYLDPEPQGGSFGLVAIDGPLTDYLGERVQLRNPTTGRSVVVYISNEVELDTGAELTISRRAFAALEELSAEDTRVTIQLLAEPV
jgi:hypothetical protein